MPSAPPESVSEPQQAIARRAGVVAAGTLSSRLLGAARDAVIAASFALPATDAFFVAWTIPNTLRRILGEGAVSAAFIPVFQELREREGLPRAMQYFRRFGAALLLALLVAAVLGVVFAHELATLYAGGYRQDPAKFATTVELTRLLFPYILLAGISALFTGLLNSMARFAVPAFAPAVLNLSLIASPFLLVPVALAMGLSPVAGLAIGALVGGVLQVLVQLPQLRRVGARALPQLALSDPQVRRSAALLLPLLLGSGVHQLNILLSRLFASFLPTGSQSYLYYGQRLVEIPQGMFAVAIASAALPSLAALKGRGDHEEAKAAFRYSLRLSLFVALPASAALAVLAAPTVTVIFGRGAFSMGDVDATARALVWMALAVWAVAAVHVITRMYYAYNDTRTPVWAAGVNLLVFASLSLSLMRSMGHEGIALASSAASICQLIVLLVLLRRRIGPLGMGEVVSSALRALLASLAMAAVVYDLARLGRWERGGNDPRNLMIYLGVVTFGALVYLAVGALLRAPESQDVLRLLGRRRKTNTP